MSKWYVKYSPEFGQEICDEICSSFDKTLEDVLTKVDPKTGERVQRDDMPCRKTIWAWRSKYPEFKKAYDEARRKQARLGLDFILHECRKLRDWPDCGKITPMNAYANYIKTLQYIYEKRFWRYSVERRLEALEDKLGVTNEDK